MFGLFKQGFARFMMCLKICALLLPQLWKEANDMAMVYATLIIKGRRTFDSVPETLQAQVREILIDCECGHLCDQVAA